VTYSNVLSLNSILALTGDSLECRDRCFHRWYFHVLCCLV